MKFVTGFFFFIFYIPFACLFWPDVYCTYFLIHVFITAYTIKVLYTHYLSVLIFLQYQLDVFAIVPTLLLREIYLHMCSWYHVLPNNSEVDVFAFSFYLADSSAVFSFLSNLRFARGTTASEFQYFSLKNFFHCLCCRPTRGRSGQVTQKSSAHYCFFFLTYSVGGTPSCYFIDLELSKVYWSCWNKGPVTQPYGSCHTS